MTDLSPSTLYLLTAIALIVIGFAGALIRRNLLKIVLGFALIDTGLHLLIAALGSNPDRTAPILNQPSLLGNPDLVVDPVPQALVLTAIVIGVGITALLLSYVIRLYAVRKSLDIREFGRLKW
ncbi:MAG: NADH-quinone oxidoreductase subunit K [Xanthomonadales bacterium]